MLQKMGILASMHAFRLSLTYLQNIDGRTRRDGKTDKKGMQEGRQVGMQAGEARMYSDSTYTCAPSGEKLG